MVDKTTEISRGNAAKRLMEDPIMAEAFQMVDNSITAAFSRHDLNDEDLKRLWLSKQMLNKIKAALTGIIETGKIAEYEVKAKI